MEPESAEQTVVRTAVFEEAVENLRLAFGDVDLRRAEGEASRFEMRSFRVPGVTSTRWAFTGVAGGSRAEEEDEPVLLTGMVLSGAAHIWSPSADVDTTRLPGRRRLAARTARLREPRHREVGGGGARPRHHRDRRLRGPVRPHRAGGRRDGRALARHDGVRGPHRGGTRGAPGRRDRAGGARRPDRDRPPACVPEHDVRRREPAERDRPAAQRDAACGAVHRRPPRRAHHDPGHRPRGRAQHPRAARRLPAGSAGDADGLPPPRAPPRRAVGPARGGPGEHHVADIAARWGFVDGRTFGRRYAEAFAESPLETLAS